MTVVTKGLATKELKESCVRELIAKSNDREEGKQTTEKSESPWDDVGPRGDEKGICAS